jgi:hypothetical protein
VVKETLVGLEVAEGQRILDRLDAAKFTVPVALWVLSGEEGHEKWRLLLASPLYDKLGPGEATLKMVHTLWPMNLDWARSPISLETTRQPLVRELRKKYRKYGDAAGLRLGGHVIGNSFVDDAYVYRIR